MLEFSLLETLWFRKWKSVYAYLVSKSAWLYYTIYWIS